MKSIGISLNTPQASDNGQLEPHPIQLHVNLWKRPHRFSCKSNKDPFYLDLGIMARFVTNEIRIYLPFKLREKNTWEDLAHILTDNKKILCDLFNEDYNISQNNSGCYHLVTNNNGSQSGTDIRSRAEILSKGCWLRLLVEEALGINKNSLNGGETPNAFYIYALGASDISVRKCEEKDTVGSIIRIKVPNQEGLDLNEYYYIRFRVAIENNKGLSLTTDLSNNLIQSAFTKLDMYNLRFNEQRDIPYGPKGILKSDGFTFAEFSKLHILYVSIPKVSVENGSAVKSNSRIIEPEEWNAYIPESYRSESYIAHHWKIPSKGQGTIGKANLFFTARYPRLQVLTIMAYVSVVIVIGCFGSILASLICGGSSSPSNHYGVLLLIVFLCYIVIWYIVTHWPLI